MRCLYSTACLVLWIHLTAVEVRVSYVEVYMERVNDLLREIGPTSQNLPLKEDRERGFYVR